MKRIVTSILVATLATAALTSCSDLDDLLDSIGVETSTTQTHVSPEKQVGEFGYQSDAPASELLEELVISEPQQNMQSYSGKRDELFPHWMEASEEYGYTAEEAAHNCDARWFTLWKDSSTQEWDDPENCILGLSTEWIDPYGKYNEDGQVEYISSDNPSKFDIDHIVSLGDAWRTGAEGWSTDDRAKLANDPLNLIATGASANRAKSDSSPEQFLATDGDFYYIPTESPVRCEIATRYTQVKHKYHLTITQGDYNNLSQVFANECN